MIKTTLVFLLLLQAPAAKVTLRWTTAGTYHIYRQTGNCQSAEVLLYSQDSPLEYQDIPPKQGLYCYHLVQLDSKGHETAIQSNSKIVNVATTPLSITLVVR